MCWKRYWLVLAITCLGSGHAVAHGPGGPRPVTTLCGPACSTPSGFALAPGCCEFPPSCCDNAWAGYCDEKARHREFWQRLTAPRCACVVTDCPSCYGSMGGAVTDAPIIATPASQGGPVAIPPPIPDPRTSQPSPAKVEHP